MAEATVVTGYCVKCKAKDKKMVNAQEVEMTGKGGKPRKAMTGTCETCGTKMFRIMGNAPAAA
jgi:Zn finger protein HypA/HybF involved in hydrogenase expression